MTPWQFIRANGLYALVEPARDGWMVSVHQRGQRLAIAIGEGRSVDVALRRAVTDVAHELAIEDEVERQARRGKR